MRVLASFLRLGPRRGGSTHRTSWQCRHLSDLGCPPAWTVDFQSRDPVRRGFGRLINISIRIHNDEHVAVSLLPSHHEPQRRARPSASWLCPKTHPAVHVPRISTRASYQSKCFHRLVLNRNPESTELAERPTAPSKRFPYLLKHTPSLLTISKPSKTILESKSPLNQNPQKALAPPSKHHKKKENRYIQ